MRDEAAVKALLEAHGLEYYPGIQPLGRQVTGKGVDVANSEHGDRACIVDFVGNAVVRVEAFACPDANALGRRVNLELSSSGLSPNRVGIDAIGVGAGTVNELQRLGKTVQRIVNSAQPMRCVEKAEDGRPVEWSPDVNQFKNFRSQSYWQLREDLRLGNIDMPKDDELWEELLTPSFVDEPKTVVEPKDEIKERLGRSPDKADALVMANWVRVRAVQHFTPEPRENQSLGYDYVAKRPQKRETGDDLMAKMMGKHRSPTAGRFGLPPRRR